MADNTPSRHEKSLGLLTTKFVSLLQEAKDGVLDLKVVCAMFTYEFLTHVLVFLIYDRCHSMKIQIFCGMNKDFILRLSLVYTMLCLDVNK